MLVSGVPLTPRARMMASFCQNPEWSVHGRNVPFAAFMTVALPDNSAARARSSHSRRRYAARTRRRTTPPEQAQKSRGCRGDARQAMSSGDPTKLEFALKQSLRYELYMFDLTYKRLKGHQTDE